MNGSATKPLFWGAIIAQVVGAQVFFWDALPDYHELTAGAVVVGTPGIFSSHRRVYSNSRLPFEQGAANCADEICCDVILKRNAVLVCLNASLRLGFTVRKNGSILGFSSNPTKKVSSK